MTDLPTKQEITEAIGRVEHPAIGTTLVDLGMIRDISVSPENAVTLTLVLPFPNIPDNIRNYMVNSVAAAVHAAGGDLTEVTVALMDDDERQVFLEKEQRFWRG